VRRVAITGLGCVSALGNDVATFWSGLSAGCCGIRRLESLDPRDLEIPLGAEARDFDPNLHFEPKRVAGLDRFSQLAVVAAREAVRDAGLDFAGELGKRAAAVFGTGVGGKTTEDAAFHRLYALKEPRVHPTIIPKVMPSAAVSQVTMDLGIRGPAFAAASACSSAAHAIALGLLFVRHGIVEAAVVGGSEASLTLGSLKAWDSMRVLSPEPCRPFSADRRGMSLGEGAAALVLEPLEPARARGARIWAELAGYGMSSDASHLVEPSQEGAVRAIKACLEDANLHPEQIVYVNAHGTGTRSNDASEARALREVASPHLPHISVSSTKSMHGHALGAAAAIELVATTLALAHGLIPPTIHFTTPDPECDLDCTPNQARPREVEAALSSSFAFGGLNCVLALRRVE